MKIQYVSDLHLEFPENRKYLRENPLSKTGDVLILAGDIICDKYKKLARDFYKEWENNYDLIISVMGNHEFYHGEVFYSQPSYRKALSDNHFKLNNATLVYDGVRFISSTLWSLVPQASKKIIETRLNDYRIIQKNTRGEPETITVQDTNDFFQLAKEYLETELKKDFQGKTVVITHHLPSFRCVNPKWRDSELGAAFASDLDEMIDAYPIDSWIFGHQHEPFNSSFSGTLFLSNPLGYVANEAPEHFLKDAVVEIS